MIMIMIIIIIIIIIINNITRIGIRIAIINTATIANAIRISFV